MDPFFEIVIKTSSILGTLIMVFYYVITHVLNKNSFPKLTKNLAFKLSRLTLWLIFSFTIICIIIILWFSNNNNNNHKAFIQGIVFLNNKGLPNVDVKIAELSYMNKTDEYGIFKVEFDENELLDIYHLELSSILIKDTTISLKNTENLSNLSFNLSSKNKSQKLAHTTLVYINNIRNKELEVFLMKQNKVTDCSININYTEEISKQYAIENYYYTGGKMDIIINGQNVYKKNIPKIGNNNQYSADRVKSELEKEVIKLFKEVSANINFNKICIND